MKKLGRKMMGIFTATAMTTAAFAGNIAYGDSDDDSGICGKYCRFRR